jgi:hypothetical protein
MVEETLPVEVTAAGQEEVVGHGLVLGCKVAFVPGLVGVDR